MSAVRARSIEVIDFEPPYEPYLCPEAIEFFEGLLRPGLRSFEWGSGTSTIWLAQHGLEVISVEDHAWWHEQVEAKLAELGLRVKTILEEDNTNYVNAILALDDASLDLVYVDGPDFLRNECVQHAKSKVKPGGWLVLDDSQWAKLRLSIRTLADWGLTRVRGQKWHTEAKRIITTETGFFQRPSEASP